MLTVTGYDPFTAHRLAEELSRYIFDYIDYEQPEGVKCFVDAALIRDAIEAFKSTTERTIIVL